MRRTDVKKSHPQRHEYASIKSIFEISRPTKMFLDVTRRAESNGARKSGLRPREVGFLENQGFSGSWQNPK